MSAIPQDFVVALAQERSVSGSELEVLLGVVEDKSPNAIAKELKISPEAVRKRLSEVYKKFHVSGVGPGKLTKLQQVIESEYRASSVSVKSIASKPPDWGEAPSISGSFYGRGVELSRLKQWIVQDKCRLVALLGMGGIGKTTLSVKLAEEVQYDFEYLIWRSLRNAPPLKELLADAIVFLSDEKEIDLPETVDSQITLLIKYLRKQRCLLVLDNAETILQGGDRAGEYKQGYEAYGQLLKRVAEEAHQSCLVLTSREKPKEFAPLEGETSPVRTLLLPGLGEIEGQEILKDKGIFGSKQDWAKLVENYSGNPLALKLVCEPIRELFAGDIAAFIDEGEIIFGDTRNLLDQQFERLSEPEAEIIYWLAIKRDPVSLEKLLDDIVRLPKRELLEALESLRRRSLIERATEGMNSVATFTLQPVVMEYITDHLLEDICQEIADGKIAIFKSHALVEATAKDYIRNTQISLIVKPILDRLKTIFLNPNDLKNQLIQIVSKLRETFPPEPGYTVGNVLNMLCQLQVDLSRYDFSGLIIWQAYLQNVNLHDVNFTGCNLAKSIFAETLGSISSVAFSPEGKLLATGDVDGKTQLWQVADGKSLLTLIGHSSPVWSVAFSPDGQIASGSDDQTVKLWNIHDGKCLKTLQGHTSRVRSVAFSPDNQTLASASEDLTVKLWDVRNGKCLKTLQGHTSWVWSVAFSPDGEILASSSDDQTVKLWDVGDGKCFKTFQGHSNWVRSVAFSPNGKILASGSEDQTVKLWDVRNGKCLKTLHGHSNRVWSVAFSPDGQTLASGSDDQTVKLWDVAGGKCLKTLYGHTNRAWSVAFSSDGQTLASGSKDQTVKLWDIRDGRCFKTLQGHTDRIRSVAFSPDNLTLASASENQTVKLWDVRDGKCLKTFQGHTNRVWSVAFSPDGETLASCSEDQTVKLWNIRDGNCLITLQGHTHRVRSVAFSPDGQTLASGSDDQTVKLWNITDGNCLITFEGHTNRVWSVAFSPDGRTLASGSDDQTVKLWDIGEGKCIKTLEEHTNWVWSVAFSPDGEILASGSEDQTVKLWNVRDGKCLKTLQEYTNRVRSVAFSPDGETLATGSEDQTVKLWNVRDGKCLKILHEHSSWVRSVAFSPDGETLASGSEDETIKLWDMHAGKCLKTLRSPKLYQGMKIAKVTGLTAAQLMTLKALGAVEDTEQK